MAAAQVPTAGVVLLAPSAPAGAARPVGAQSRHNAGGRDGRIVVVTRREQVGHPQREAVHHHGRAIGDIAEGFFDFDRFFHRGP